MNENIQTRLAKYNSDVRSNKSFGQFAQLYVGEKFVRVIPFQDHIIRRTETVL